MKRIASSTWIALGLTAGLVALLVLPFLLRPPPPAPPQKSPGLPPTARKLVIVSPHWEGIRTEFGRAFSEWTSQNLGHPTQLEWLDVGGTSDGIRYVRAQFKKNPDGIDVDLFFGGGVDPYMQFTKEGLLSPCRLPPEVLKPIPPEFAGIEVYDREGRWFGACLAGFGIVYNKKVLSLLKRPEPKTWEDLARPDYLSWVGSGDPRSSGSVHMAYEIILQAYGWERGWANIVRMGGNIRNFSRAGSDVPKDAAIGEIACGLAIDVYAWRQVAEVGADRMGFCLPEGLTVINPDGIAVLKGAPNRDLAEKFIAFVIGEPGQKLWSFRVGTPGGPQKFELDRIPVIPGFGDRFPKERAVPFDAYSWKGGFTYDPQKGSRRWDVVNDMIGAFVIDTHADLVAACRAMRNLPADDPRALDLVRPPLTEEEALRLAREKWNDASARAQIRAQWTESARSRYRKIAQILKS